VPARGGGGHLPFLAGVCAGAAAGGVGAYALLSRRGAGDAVDTSVDGTKSAVAHPAMRAGWPSGFEDLLRVRSGFVASYDARTRNPRWVLERITAESCDGVGTRKKSRFAEDDEVDGAHAAKLSDYRGSGYDRGHLAAAAGHKNTQRAMDDTFSLINVSPQVGDGFNRDYWARLEHFTRLLATKTKAGGDVLVATGPLFLPTKVGASERRAREFRESMDVRGDGGDKKGGKTRDVSTALVDVSSSAKARPPADWEMRYPLIGDAPELVHVPTHFFKVVLVLPAGDRDDERLDANDKNKDAIERVAAAAFVLPNAPIPPDTPLETFLVPLAKLEAASGLTFFRQGALGGEAREAFEASERLYFESRSGGEASETAARVTSRSRSKSRAEHVCQAAACVLPAGFAAKQTRGG
jgi:DNA/RNA endonuclease G (NUC1)